MTLRRLVLPVLALALLFSATAVRASDRAVTTLLLRSLPDAGGGMQPTWPEDASRGQRWPLETLNGDRPIRLEAPFSPHRDRLAPHQGLMAPRQALPWPDIQRMPRLPGEFEPQRALLLGGHELLTEMPELYADLVEATQNQIEIITMVNDATEAELSRSVLDGRAVQVRPHLLPAAHNTMWARDYGPITVEDEGQPTLVDTDYAAFERPDDDQVPATLGGSLGLPVVKSPLALEGGNLLSNGRGLCLTTTKVLEDNAAVGDEVTVAQWIARSYGGVETVFLEPLRGESTGHVDMFATLVAPNVAVVGCYTREQDAENAAVLNRNARRLSQLRVDGKPMKVVRLPMPPHDDGVWRTYTNVVFANGVLLVPVYPGRDEVGQRRALRTYARLLPGWRVVGIDASQIIECGGALHCVVMNMGPLRAIPRFPAPPAAPGLPLMPGADAPRQVAGFSDSDPLWKEPNRLPEFAVGR